ncbi:hypothetical protein PGT21_023677 [Puccinia graminis f. sp. tritici]|uniref:RRM domain-containing protein n=1 Tax=Puccinia graminis f. sp. tritici TaxID=56615 RepID=A0A5B0PK01_PUCGR|nr:hypothetical protein PGT21_023677 [Puccinia graminis f. sp. tritici]
MNNIKATKAINEQELKLGIKASWHDDYKDSAYIYIGGLDTGLTEGDIITIFSQYGEPVDINLPKEKPAPPASSSADKPNDGPSVPTSNKKPKSRGFCFLMYENQLSTNLAVDNLNGAIVLGRTLRVDHCKNYKQLERNQEGKVVERDADLGERLNARPELHIQPRETAGDQQDPEDDHREGSIDPEDPMAAYILKERRKRRKENDDQGNHHQKTLKDSRKHKRKQEETEEERAARKDAKRIKKLLKEVGASKTRDHDRAGETDRREARDDRRDRSPRRDYDRHIAQDSSRRKDRSPRRGEREHERDRARDDRGYRRSDRDR